MNINRLRRMQRVCLKCSTAFKAHGRFNRICSRCKEYHVSGIEVCRLILPWS